MKTQPMMVTRVFRCLNLGLISSTRFELKFVCYNWTVLQSLPSSLYETRRRARDSRGAFHSTKISGFENFLVPNGTWRVRTVSFHSPRKRSFALIEMKDVESLLLLVLELRDDFDGDNSDIVWAVSSVVLFWADHSQIFAVWVQTPLLNDEKNIPNSLRK